MPGGKKPKLPTRAQLLSLKVSKKMTAIQELDALWQLLAPDDYLVLQIVEGKHEDQVELIGGYFICLFDNRVVLSPKHVHCSDKGDWEKVKTSCIRFAYIKKSLLASWKS